MELDMLKDGSSLPSIGMCYGMLGSKGLFHTFGPNQTDLAELMKTAIVGGPSIVFKWHAQVGLTAMWMLDYGAKALSCHALDGFDVNSLYPWAMAQDIPIRACQVRSEPDYALDA